MYQVNLILLSGKRYKNQKMLLISEKNGNNGEEILSVDRNEKVM